MLRTAEGVEITKRGRLGTPVRVDPDEVTPMMLAAQLSERCAARADPRRKPSASPKRPRIWLSLLLAFGVGYLIVAMFGP